MESLPVITLNDLVTGGIIGAVLTGVFAAVHILLNKKVKAPSDIESDRRAAIVERNEVVALYKKDLADAKEDINRLRTEQETQAKRMEVQEDEIDMLKSEALANEHYIYRCIATIYRLGTAADIPKPPPTKIRLTGDNHNG